MNIKILYECLHGSHAYGLNTPESDFDYKGFGITPIEYYLGFLNKFEQLEQKHPNDRVIYDIKKFCKLASDCNPNIIEILFCDESEIVTITESGQLLRNNRDLFISKKAKYTFMGYAFAQLKRIRSHRHWILNPIKNQPKRSDYGLPEEKKLVSDDQLGAFLNILCGILDGSLEKSNLSEETKQELREVNTIGLLQRNFPEYVWTEAQKLVECSDNFVEAAMKEKKYKAAMNNWKSYQNWKKNRNPKRAEIENKIGFDGKHASHLVRLIRMGEEIISGKGVIVKRPDKEELLAIKQGKIPYEEIEKYAENMDEKMNELYKKSPLPREPNRNKIDQLCQEILTKELNLKEV